MNFTADKVKMYESVREALAGIYIPLTPYPFPGRSNDSLHEKHIEERDGKYNRKIRGKKLKKDVQEYTKK